MRLAAFTLLLLMPLMAPHAAAQDLQLMEGLQAAKLRAEDSVALAAAQAVALATAHTSPPDADSNGSVASAVAANVGAAAAAPAAEASIGCAAFTDRERCLHRKKGDDCHHGLRPCACAWCDDARCVDYLPCSNRTEFDVCRSSVVPDTVWTCDAWSSDELARKINLVILSSAFWWPCGVLLARALFHRMKQTMPVSLVTLFLWLVAGAGPFLVNALLVYRNESTWTVLVSGFFWWYAICLLLPLLLLFVVGMWRLVRQPRARLHPAYKMVAALVFFFMLVLLYLVGEQIHETALRFLSPRPVPASAAPSWPIIYKITLLLLWLQLIYPLEKLRLDGRYVPLASLVLLGVVSTAVLVSQLHRGFSSEVNWLGIAAFLPAFILLLDSWNFASQRNLFGMQADFTPCFAVFLLVLWVVTSGLCMVLPPLLHRHHGFVHATRYIYVVLLNVAAVLPLALPLFDSSDAPAPFSEEEPVGSPSAVHPKRRDDPVRAALQAEASQQRKIRKQVRDLEEQLDRLEEELSEDDAPLLTPQDDGDDEVVVVPLRNAASGGIAPRAPAQRSASASSASRSDAAAAKSTTGTQQKGKQVTTSTGVTAPPASSSAKPVDTVPAPEKKVVPLSSPAASVASYSGSLASSAVLVNMPSGRHTPPPTPVTAQPVTAEQQAVNAVAAALLQEEPDEVSSPAVEVDETHLNEHQSQISALDASLIEAPLPEQRARAQSDDAELPFE